MRRIWRYWRLSRPTSCRGSEVPLRGDTHAFVQRGLCGVLRGRAVRYRRARGDTVDSIAQAVRPGPTEPDVGAVKFYGVVADATVDGVTFSGNDAWASYAEIQTTGSSQWLRINVASGAQRGSLAGLTVDYMQISLRLVPARSPDAKPPQDAAAFQAGIDPLYAPKIVLKHHSSVFTGIGAPGPQVEGPLTAIR
jgi:hypothetical protein